MAWKLWSERTKKSKRMSKRMTTSTRKRTKRRKTTSRRKRTRTKRRMNKKDGTVMHGRTGLMFSFLPFFADTPFFCFGRLCLFHVIRFSTGL